MLVRTVAEYHYGMPPLIAGENYFGLVFRASEFATIDSEIGIAPSLNRDSSRKPPSMGM